MKTLPLPLACTLLAFGLMAPGARADLTADMKTGTPAFQAMSQLAFGPEGVLFIADTKAAAIVAVATGDTTPATGAAMLKAEAINEKIAALAGTRADEIIIEDLAVNPLSRRAYLAVSRGKGPDAVPLLVRVKPDGQPELVSLEQVKFSRAELPNPAADSAGTPGRKQGQNRRLEAITDIAYADGKLLVAGLSNEEFSSTLRVIPVPFRNVDRGTAVEIYHGAHGQFETRAPVRTFVPYRVGKEQHVLAAYTCTPLVQFAINDLKPGAKIQGKTIAEFGNRNRPLDIIVYQKDGKDYLLLANSARGVIKVAAEQITGAAPITAKVAETQGLKFEKVDWTGVTQLDRFDGRHAIVVRTGAGSALNLETLALP